jgi:hypothetical protein
MVNSVHFEARAEPLINHMTNESHNPLSSTTTLGNEPFI